MQKETASSSNFDVRPDRSKGLGTWAGPVKKWRLVESGWSCSKKLQNLLAKAGRVLR